MADTTFTDNDLSLSNRVVAAWLNDVNRQIYKQSIHLDNAPYNIRDGDDIKSALNTALATLTASTSAIGNKNIIIPPGNYTCSGPVASPNSASHFRIIGSGFHGTHIQWTGAAGVPMFQFPNAAHVYLEHMYLEGATGTKPSYLVNFHRAASLVGSFGASGCGVMFCRLGGDASDHTTGIGYTAAAGQDTNNEQGLFLENLVNGSASYGYFFGHSNSLLHKIIGGSVAYYGTAAICNDSSGASNASFSCDKVAFGGNATSSVLYVASPRFPINMVDCNFENVGALDTCLLRQVSPWVAGQINFRGGYYAMADPVTRPTITFDADQYSTLNLFGTVLGAPSGITISLPSVGPRVRFWGGALTLATLTYNCEVALYDVEQGAGSPTYTNSGSGVLRLVRSDGTSRLDIALVASGNATSFSADGRSSDIVYLSNTVATNLDTLTNGYLGQQITLIATNGNTTIKHTAAATANMFKLNGAADFVMAANNSLTLKRGDATTGNSQWFEIGRKV